jgi:hypothetical protein
MSMSSPPETELPRRPSPTGLKTYIGDTGGKITILLEARRWLHVSYLLPQMLQLDSRKDEAKL